MKPAHRKFILALAAAFLCLLAAAAWWFLPGRRAEVRLPAVSSTAVPRATFDVEPFHLQTDPRWAADTIGGSGESLGSVGCTLCCLSMALSHLGVAETPATLNAKLKDADGYTYRGWIKWDAVRRVTDERIEVLLPQNPGPRDIEDALAAGSPVLAKVILPSGFQHWVLLVGRDGREYLMKDPLGDGSTLRPLSSLDSDILAVRIVRRAMP